MLNKTPTAAHVAASRTSRPVFFEDQSVDALWDVISALTTELGATRARLDTLERVLEDQKLVHRDMLENWVPSPVAAKERTYANQSFIARIYNTLVQK